MSEHPTSFSGLFPKKQEAAPVDCQTQGERMTKDKALDLALEALEDRSSLMKWQKAITAIKQARALDKKADNARELGLDYDPAGGTQVSKVWWDGEKLMAKPIPLEDVYLPAPAQEPDTYGYAKRLAEAIWKKHYKATAPQWEPLDGLMGVLTQIDNMTSGLTTPPAQEPWNPNDTAHRPGGLPQDFIKHEVESFDDWSEWVNPKPEQYFMKCCDCGLVHEMQFKVAKYAEGDECEFVEDADLQAVFRARRTTPPTAPVQEPVATVRTWHMNGDQHAELGDWEIGLFKLPDGEHTLYTTPPATQRQWVGLTTEDMATCINEPAWDLVLRKADQILKEKNT